MSGKGSSKQEAWKKKIADWETSGLTIARWCEKNEEEYYRFRYWRHVLKKREVPTLFQEIKESEEKLEIELKYEGITITFPKGCTPSLLKSCQRALKEKDPC